MAQDQRRDQGSDRDTRFPGRAEVFKFSEAPAEGKAPADNGGTPAVNPATRRKHERHGFFRRTSWDFFTGSTGKKTGFITNISKGGCLLKTSEPVEHRRWVRMMVHDNITNVCYSLVGRVIRRENAIESINTAHGTEITLYRYGIEFTFPNILNNQGRNQDADLILALSSKNLTVRSCLNLNEKSSLRPGSLA